jgi:hypothetical protein
MNYIRQLIGENESVVRISRDHWTTLLPTALVDVLASIVIVGVCAFLSIKRPAAWYGLVLLLIPIGQFLIRLWTWANRKYVVTTQRVLQVAGVLNKRVSDTSLDKVNDIVMEQTALGRVLGYGDIEVITGTESGIDVFRRISNPIAFKRSMLNQSEALSGVGAIERRVGQLLAAPTASASNIPELIEALDELRQKGLISEAEFEQKRQQLLDKI